MARLWPSHGLRRDESGRGAWSGELTGRVNTVLIGDNLPELGTDLVTALASLDVNELALQVQDTLESV